MTMFDAALVTKDDNPIQKCSDITLLPKFEAPSTRNADRHPTNHSNLKKWTITLIISFYTILVSASATSYNLGVTSMIRDLHCAQFQATIGLSLYAFGFGIFPLFTSSFSEEFGRQPLYIVSLIGYLAMHLAVALSTNIQTVIIARALQGGFGSTGATVVAGTIADIWEPHERGLPMSMFSLFAFAGNGLGAVIGGWIEMNTSLAWRWIQWIQLIIGGVYFVLVYVVMDETRPTNVRLHIMKKPQKEIKEEICHVHIKKDSPSLRGVIWVSCTRPMQLLVTEPIVFSVSLWIGFAWGVYYCIIESIPIVFKTIHNFNTGQVGMVYLTMLIGGLLGFITNFAQEALYRKHHGNKGVEARLYLSCLAGVVFPSSMFIFAFTSTHEIHWIVPIIALTVYIWATFTIYLAVFSYLADCYGVYASSACAGQSLFRNTMAGIFPLFADRMFGALGFKWSNSLFACIGAVLSPVPLILLLYGTRLRKRSAFSSKD